MGCASVGEEIREFKAEGWYTDSGQEGRVDVSYDDAPTVLRVGSDANEHDTCSNNRRDRHRGTNSWCECGREMDGRDVKNGISDVLRRAGMDDNGGPSTSTETISG